MLLLLRRNWLLAGLALTALLAWWNPELGRSGGVLHLERWQPWLVAGIFLLSGLSLPSRMLGAAAGCWRAHLLIQGLSLAVAPLLLVIADRCGIFNGLAPGLRIGLIALACLPTTITSGVTFTRVSGGDEALAVFNATLGSLLGVALSPLLVLAFTGLSADLDRGALLWALTLQTAVPLALGQNIRRAILRTSPVSWSGLGILSNLLLLALLWQVFSTTVASGVLRGAHLPLALLLVTVIFVGLFAIASWIAGWRWFALDRPQRIAVVISASQKSAALGVPLLTVMATARPDIGLLCLPVVLYHVLQLLVAGAMVPVWRRWAGLS